MNPRRLAAPALALTLAAAGCERPASTVTALPSPAAPGSAEPNLAVGPSGRVYLTWVEPRDSGHALRLAELVDDAWSAPRDVAAGRRWFVNWADFPSLLAVSDSVLVAHWLQREGGGRYAYGVRLTRSEDGGATWSAPLRPHTDPEGPEHGFVSLWPEDSGRVAAVWLDGRKFPAAEARHAAGDTTAQTEMTLRTATIHGGAVSGEAELDGRICDCCQTAAALTADGPVVVYRDRGQDETRDIYITRRVGGVWTAGRPVAEDGWVINACPVNGPMVAAQGRRVAVAWFTNPGERRTVYAAFSDDAGGTFGPKIRVDDGRPVGRVAVVLDATGALVSWLEETNAAAEVRVRRVAPDSTVGPAHTVATTAGARPAGFPRMAVAGDRLVFAWTLPPTDSTSSSVRTAAVRVP